MTERAACLPALAEAFREHGYEGASLAVLSSATGLGRGSLYNFFPGGKEEMMAAVLADIDNWFERAVFLRLEQAGHGAAAIRSMIGDVTAYFQAGGRVCLLGWIGLGSSRDGFAERVKGYFSRWISSLAACLERGGVAPEPAAVLAEEAVSAIQGAIVLSRALGDERVFLRIVEAQQTALLAAMD